MAARWKPARILVADDGGRKIAVEKESRQIGISKNTAGQPCFRLLVYDCCPNGRTRIFEQLRPTSGGQGGKLTMKRTAIIALMSYFYKLMRDLESRNAVIVSIYLDGSEFGVIFDEPIKPSR